MATNLSLDPKLIERALELSGERTKRVVNGFAPGRGVFRRGGRSIAAGP